MVKIIGRARSQEQAASAITDLRNRNLIHEGRVLCRKKEDSFGKDNIYKENDKITYDGAMAGLTLSSSPEILIGDSIASNPFSEDQTTSESNNDNIEQLIDGGINKESAQMIEHWLNEDKYVVLVECKQEVSRIIEILEGLHGIDNVMKA